MLTLLLCVAVAPAVICGILLLVTGALKPANDARLAWSLPLAVAIGVNVAELGGGTPHFPPVEASDWFGPIAVVIAVIAVVRAKIPAWPLRVGVAIAVVAAICHPLFGGAWTVPQGLAWCAAMVAVIAVSFWSVDRAAAVASGFGLPVALVVIATGAAVSVAAGGSAHYGQAIGAVASAVGPLIVLGLIRRNAVLTRGAWAPFIAVASVVVAALTFVDVPVIACVLLMAAFALLPLADIGPLASRPRWQREIVRIVVSGILVAIAIVLSLPAASTDGY